MLATESKAIFCHHTALGKIWSTWTEDGLFRVQLDRPDSETSQIADRRIQHFDQLLAAFCESGQASFDGVKIDTDGWTDFSRRVYDACRQIRPGQICTYKQLAIRVGSPKASRAVGAAMARNRVLLVIPCHRVIASNGQLRGFSAPGGLATKQRLLDLENASDGLFA